MLPILRVLLLCLACLAAARPMASETLRTGSPIPAGRLSFKVYGADQGLGNLAAWALAQDAAGFIWVGTEDGLFRFEGQRFQAFSLKDGLSSALVDVLHISPDGTLWAGTYKGLCYFKEGRFVALGPAQGLPNAQVTGISSGPDGQILVGMSQGLFQQKADGSFQPLAGYGEGGVTALWSRPGGAGIWVASWTHSRSTVRFMDSTGWKTLDGTKGFTGERMDALAMDGRGVIWARSLKNLWMITPGHSAFEPLEPRLPETSQKGFLYVDPRGQLWVTTTKGLYRNLGGRWERLCAADGLPKDTLHAAMEDREGSLWAAAEGAYRLQGGGVLRAYSIADGFPNEVVWSIARNRAGDLFVGTDGGLVQAKDSGWKLVPGTANFQVRTIVQAPDAALFLAGGPEILRVDPKGGVQRFGSAHGIITSGRIYRLLFDRRGDLWAAADGGGLLKGQGQGTKWTFQHQTLPEGTATERIQDLFEDASGRLWATGEKGLVMWDGKAWHRYTSRDGLRNDHLDYVRGTRAGDLIISYFDPLGLCRATFANGTFKVIEHLDRVFPPEKVIYQYTEDAKGNFWVGTGQGLTLISPDGRTEQFGRGEGLLSEDTNAMAVLPEPNGDLWIGTSGGLARFDAAAYKGAPQHPATVLLDCRLGGKVFPVVSPEPSRVPHAANTFTVKFAGLSFIREGAVQHQVRLEGLENEWHFSATREERYPALPHGKYRFEARSRVGQGEWGPISSFEFEVLPAWWESAWFRVLLVVALGGLIVLIVRSRVAALRRRNRSLEAMVAARTREVEAKAAELAKANDALRNQSLTDPLTGLRNRRYLGVCMPEDVAQVQRVHRDVVSSRTDRVLMNIDLVFLMVDIDHFKFVNDHHGHAAGDRVLQQVAEILKNATRDSDTVVRWGGEEFLVVARNAARRESAILAERIRSQMEAHVFDLEDGTHLHRTCSIGFTFYPFISDKPSFLPWEQVLDIADHCLFAAKRGGRNAWVGVFPTEDGDADIIKTAMPMEIPALFESGDIDVTTSLPDPAALDWNLKGE
ncbi:MAG: diguanylate cyclase [Holophaga sp.]|nr:diguanylate cyclase [Holophaga sp.]